jgi:hypothetical protein
MKEFTDPRELIGQIGLDLDAKSGKISSSFRDRIRSELEKIGDKDSVSVSIKQVANGSLISLNINDWVDRQDRAKIEQQFKNLMNRFGASSSGTCSGIVPGNLAAFLN